MRESNQKPLREAIARLPEHRPAAELWGRISRDLDALGEQEKLKAAVAMLPEHRPGPDVWAAIASDLDQAGLQKPLMHRLYRFAVTAAAVLLVGVVAFWLRGGPEATVTMQYSTAESGDWQSDIWNTESDDEAAVEEVVGMFVRNPVALQSGDYDLLQSELQELNSARSELLEMLETYGQDQQLMLELKEIEIARSEVVKQMARYI